MNEICRFSIIYFYYTILILEVYQTRSQFHNLVANLISIYCSQRILQRTRAPLDSLSATKIDWASALNYGANY